MTARKPKTELTIVNEPALSPAAETLLSMTNIGSPSPEMLQSLSILTSASTPEFAIQTHPGKGGKIMKYINHVWVTEQLRNAFGQMWGMSIGTIMAFDDSVSAVVTLYVDFPKKDGTLYRRTISEIGAFDGGGGKMSKAMMVASAVSRGLVKACFRMFGLGQDLYPETPEPTLKDAWVTIKTMGNGRGLTNDQIADVIKELKFQQKDLLDRFVEIYNAVYRASVDKGDIPTL